MGKSRRIAVVTDATPPSPKLPALAAAGASLIGFSLALVIVGWGALRSVTARA